MATSRADIVVTIGAQQDRSVEAAFRQMERRAEQAAKRMPGGRGSGSAKPEFKAAQDIYRERSKLNRAQYSEEARAQREKERSARNAARETARERMRELRMRQREERQQVAAAMAMDRQRASANLREWNRAQAATLRGQRASDRAIDRFSTRTSHRSTRFLFPAPEGALGYAKRTAWDLARGAGVDLSAGSSIARAKELSSAGGGLAAQERIATGQTRGGSHYTEMARTIGGDLQADPEQVMALMRSFTGKTGEFAKLGDITSGLASMAIASGASLEEMGDAAGLVYNQLKMLPDAGKQTIEVMRGIIGQTAVGAVEMKDYATQIGRVAAQANKFEGPASENIKKMSALTQLAMASGGASTPADAARALVAFSDTFGKGERINAFANEGIDIFADQKTTGKGSKRKIAGTRIRDPLALIEDALTKTGGDIPRMAKLFASVIGVKPVRALATTYQNAGGGDNGIVAVRGMFKSFMGSSMSSEVERANLADRRTGTSAKAQDFQNQMDRIVATASTQLIPAMEKLGPATLGIVDGFTTLATWASQNVGPAIALAIGGSIARAGLESTFRMAIDKAATSLMSGRSSTLGSLDASGKIGAAATGIMIAAATFTIASAVLNLTETIYDKDEQRVRSQTNNIMADYYQKRDALTGKGTPAEEAAAKAALIRQTSTNLGNTMASRGILSTIFGDSDKGFDEAMKRLSGELEGADVSKIAARRARALAAGTVADGDAQRATIDPEKVGESVARNLRAGKLIVHVDNLPQSPDGDARVDDGVRLGP